MTNWASYYNTIITVLDGLRPEGCESGASLGFTARPSFKTKPKKLTNTNVGMKILLWRLLFSTVELEESIGI